jgi:hypothetical protein
MVPGWTGFTVILLPGNLHEPTERVDQAHLLDRPRA